MNEPTHHLAQLNVARMIAPLEDPVMAGFVAQLDTVNALADASPGFVWRLQTDDGDATALRVFDDSKVLVNLSVWESLESLREFAYRGQHKELLKDRRHWFENMDGPYVVLWWIPAGHLPTVEEAKARLQTLRTEGPSEKAFTFGQSYPAPSAAAAG